MAVKSILAGIQGTLAEQTNAAAGGADVAGLLSTARQHTDEMINVLNTVIARLPNGDPNIATLQAVVTNLSG